jgi:hypothetical protein
MKDEVFTPGKTIQYNPLQKKVTVEGIVDTRRDNTRAGTGAPTAPFGSVENPTVLINGAQSSSTNNIGLPQSRAIVVDGAGQVGGPWHSQRKLKPVTAAWRGCVASI